MSARKHLPKLTLPMQKVEGAESLYRDAFLGIATSRTNTMANIAGNTLTFYKHVRGFVAGHLLSMYYKR